MPPLSRRYPTTKLALQYATIRTQRFNTSKGFGILFFLTRLSDRESRPRGTAGALDTARLQKKTRREEEEAAPPVAPQAAAGRPEPALRRRGRSPRSHLTRRTQQRVRVRSRLPTGRELPGESKLRCPGATNATCAAPARPGAFSLSERRHPPHAAPSRDRAGAARSAQQVREPNPHAPRPAAGRGGGGARSGERGGASFCACALRRAPWPAPGACALAERQRRPEGRAAAGKWRLRLLLPRPLARCQRPGR